MEQNLQKLTGELQKIKEQCVRLLTANQDAKQLLKKLGSELEELLARCSSIDQGIRSLAEEYASNLLAQRRKFESVLEQEKLRMLTDFEKQKDHMRTVMKSEFTRIMKAYRLEHTEIDTKYDKQVQMEVAKSMKKLSGSIKKYIKEKIIQEEDSDEDEDEVDSEDDGDDDSEDDDDNGKEVSDEEDDDDDDKEGSDEEDDDDDEEESGDEEVDQDDDSKEEEEEEDIKPGQKRKAKQPVKNQNKKAKLETSVNSGFKSLFIRMTSSDVESSTIEKFFDTHGVKIQEVRRIGGRNFAYADVSESQLEAALKLSGKKMAGKQVQILLANEKSEKTQDKTLKPKSDESKKRTLFVKNLGFDIKDADIKAHFPLAQKIFAPRKMDGKLKGHGYLEFESEAVADKVLTKLQNSTLCGRAICLDYVGDKRQNTTPLKQPDENCKTLCVKQLNYKITSEQLKNFFKKSTDARIVKDTKTDRSKGFGFVVFDSHEHAAKALQNMQGKDMNGRNLVISFALKKTSKPEKSKRDSKSKKTSKKGSKNMKGGTPTKNRPTDKLKKSTKNKFKKADEGDSS